MGDRHPKRWTSPACEYRAPGASGESLAEVRLIVSSGKQVGIHIGKMCRRVRVASLRKKAHGRLAVLMERSMDVHKGKDVSKVGLA